MTQYENHTLSVFSAYALGNPDPAISQKQLNMIKKIYTELGKSFAGQSRKILDIGASDGSLAQTFLQTTPNWKATLVDGAPGFLTACARKHFSTNDLHLIDLEKKRLPADFRDEYDLTISFATLPFIKNSPRVIQDMIMATKPGGLIIAQIANCQGSKDIATTSGVMIGGKLEQLPIYVYPEKVIPQILAPIPLARCARIPTHKDPTSGIFDSLLILERK